MYSGLRDAVHGFSKNLFALFNYRILVALFVWAWLLVVTWQPILSFVSWVVTGRGAPQVAGASLVVASGIWLLTSLKFGLPRHLFLLGPAIVTMSAFVGLRAMLLALVGRASWKGRLLIARRSRVI
jgi:chlorobactene glucosyltransferase